jgi:hypothetical protein
MDGTGTTRAGDGNCMGYKILVRDPNLRVGKIILKEMLK